MAKGLYLTESELEVLMSASYLVEADEANKNDEADKKVKEFYEKLRKEIKGFLKTEVTVWWLLPPKVVKKLQKAGIDVSKCKVQLGDNGFKAGAKALWNALKEHKTGAFKELRKKLCQTAKAIITECEEVKGVFNCESDKEDKEKITAADFDVMPLKNIFVSIFTNAKDFRASTGVRLGVKAALFVTVLIALVGIVKRYKGYSFVEAINPKNLILGLKQYITDTSQPWYGKFAAALLTVLLAVLIANIVWTEVVPVLKDKLFNKDEKKENEGKSSQNESK